ncbi:NAD(P)H-binding protein [Companilactobacillus sp. DQM5]|uniref:NAD(P)H-binding protein n=1 Tax=Companilactobacillus sp. DQM5 TaxID=3463359 RepID=UPI004059F072
MGRILVTGASGNVGKYVVKYALKNYQEVTVAGTNIDKLNNMFGDNVGEVKFDFMDHTTFSDALKDVDRVFIMRPPHLGNPNDLRPFIEEMKSKNSIKLIGFYR